MISSIHITGQAPERYETALAELKGELGFGLCEKGVRVNTISQSPTPTTAGKGIKEMENLMDFAGKMSPLGNASADECADYCVVMYSDLTRKVTMQTLFHDGGFSNMGMSLRGMTQYNKSFIDENTDQETGKIIYG